MTRQRQWVEGQVNGWPYCIDYYDYCTLYSLPVFSLAKNLQLILEINAIYRLVSYLLVDKWLIGRLRAQCMISTNNINSGSLSRVWLSLFSSKQCIIKQLWIGFCNILNNEGLDECYQSRPSARLITLASTLPHPVIANYLVDCNDDDEDDRDNDNDDVKLRQWWRCHVFLQQGKLSTETLVI